VAHISGEFRAFQVNNGISMVLAVGGSERRVHLSPEQNFALFEFLRDRIAEVAEEAEGQNG